MTRKFDGNKLVLATHNKGKVAEIGALLAPYDVTVVSAGELGLSEPEETGQSFAENAALKAWAAAKASNLPALADDSGLAVTALGGAPGIYSARWAGPDKDFSVAMKRVWDSLQDFEDHSAAFICALALSWPDGHTEHVEGRVDGTISWPPRGAKGFGYDPIFVPNGHDRTFAEMALSEKQAMSHRTNAFKLLVSRCFD